MKWLLPICLVICFQQASAQTLTVPSVTEGDNIKTILNVVVTPGNDLAILHNGKLETSAGITFTNTELDLQDITIKAKTITIPSGIARLKISGNVKFVCEDLVIETATGALLCEGNGTLTFLYAHRMTISRPVSQQPADGQNLMVAYKTSHP